MAKLVQEKLRLALFPIKKLSDISAELNALRDARICVELGDERLPSICCYTFHNAADR